MKGYPEGSPQTVKEAGTAGALARGEWETELDGTTPDLAKTKKTPLEKLTAKKLHRKLKPIFRTSVRRMTQPIRTRRSEIELAVDRGSITSGRRSRPISEFELELKGGISASCIGRGFSRTMAHLMLHAIWPIGWRTRELQDYQSAEPMKTAPARGKS